MACGPNLAEGDRWLGRLSPNIYIYIYITENKMENINMIC